MLSVALSVRVPRGSRPSLSRGALPYGVRTFLDSPFGAPRPSGERRGKAAVSFNGFQAKGDSRPGVVARWLGGFAFLPFSQMRMVFISPGYAGEALLKRGRLSVTGWKQVVPEYLWRWEG